MKLSIRDHFALHALKKVGDLGFTPSMNEPEGDEDYKKQLDFKINIMVKYAYMIADAMLKERINKDKK